MARFLNVCSYAPSTVVLYSVFPAGEIMDLQRHIQSASNIYLALDIAVSFIRAPYIFPCPTSRLLDEPLVLYYLTQTRRRVYAKQKRQVCFS
jgi:hypothetical protein